MKKLTTLIISSLFSLSLMAQGDQFNKYDKNGDGKLCVEEYTNMLSDQELYQKWDVNQDGNISLEEWRTGLYNYYPAYLNDENIQYAHWDMDADNLVYDAEFSIGNFTLWDTNLNQQIDAEEFAAYKDWDEQDLENTVSAR